MKKLFINRLSLCLFLFLCLFSSSAFLLLPQMKILWREISDAQAKKQSLKIPSWAPMVERAQPAVLVITTEAVVEQPVMEFPGLPFLIPMPPERQQGKGSGFIINQDGYFITNEHVIQGAQKIKVRVGLNRKEYNAKIIGSDEALDLALGQIEYVDPADPTKKIVWPYLPMGNSDELKLGEAVMALGNPLGLDQSVNVGIVSQKHRSGIKPNGRDLFIELIQLQMPINPGNSGGPVVDDSGRVVAVSESIMASGNAIAFGVPINIVKEMLPFLEKGGIEKTYLGIETLDLSPELAKKLGLPEDQQGVVVAQVHPNTPAKKAGLEVMDVILEVDGVQIPDFYKLRRMAAYKGVGQTINLKIYRQGRGNMDVKVKLEKRPGQTTQFQRPHGANKSH
ncbi:MAG TPA: trypsin-like peptidase domain-containing protein, partial [Myxococcota bacterium]|nr:trypsin-like peptidase domain-containing protein [Myxococcota bacterium]